MTARNVCKQIKPTVVELFFFLTNDSSAWHTGYVHWLSDEEKTRANKLVTARNRNRYLQTSIMKRIILSQYTGIAPRDLLVKRDDLGKPWLHCQESQNAEIKRQFSISRGEQMHLVGISDAGSIGVDIEALRPVNDWRQLAPHCLSDHEISYLSSIEKNRQHECFWRYWAAKEAILKAVGVGLRCEPSNLVLKSSPVSKLKTENGLAKFCSSYQGQCWYVYSNVYAGNVYAVATSDPVIESHIHFVDTQQLLLADAG